VLGEKLVAKRMKKLLVLCGHGGEDLLGWDTGDVTVFRAGQVFEMKGLLLATSEAVDLLDQASSQHSTIPWESITSTDTRVGEWKTDFILQLRDGVSVTLRTIAPRPVQTLISDWVAAGQRQQASIEARVKKQGYISLDDREAMVWDIQRRWEAGELNPPPSFKVEDSSIDVGSLPQGPVSSWRICPACTGELLTFDGMAECRYCRRIWCDPEVEPVLDQESGALVGREQRIPMTPTDFETGNWLRPAVYMRFPNRDGTAWPGPGAT
jgi:hypothetical protein